MFTVISGTNRIGSYSRRIAAIVERIYAMGGHAVRMVDLVDLPASAFRPEAFDETPSEMEPLVSSVVEAHALVVVTPEYNGGFPGILKHFVDLLPVPQGLEGKPTCFIGVSAGRWGGQRPVEHLRDVFLHRKALVHPEIVVVRECETVVDAATGAPLNSEIVERLEAQANFFCEFAGRVGRQLATANQ